MIATFYSFKGGVGRSMALANVAELLADAGYRVLACDWDLEAPGLERYFCEEREQLLEFRKNPGVIDLLLDYKESLTQPTAAKEPSAEDDENFRPIGTDGLRVRKPASFAVKISSNQRQSSGWIKLLSAGRRDGESYARYTEAVRNFDWAEFYTAWAGAAYVDFLRCELERAADIILIDSRTGVTEAGGVCTHQLADMVLLFSAANDQNVEGTRWMAEILRRPELKKLRPGRDLAIVPIASRIERNADVDFLTPFRRRFVAEFSQYLPSEIENLSTFIQQAEIPYIAKYSFSESIVARQPREDRLQELASPYEVISEAIVTYGRARQLLDVSAAGQASLRSIPETVRVTAVVPKGQFVIIRGVDEADQVQSLINGLRAVGLDVWTELDSSSDHTVGVTPYFDAIERSAGRLLLVSPSDDELRLNVEINSILAQQAQRPAYRALLLIGPSSKGLRIRPINPLLKRLAEFELLPASNPAANAAKIVAALLPDPALIPEPDRDLLADKIGAKTEMNSRFLLGRDKELSAALSWLMEGIQIRRRIAIISGASGEGKSAFIQAGVIPALRRGLLRPDRRSWKITNIQLRQKTLEDAMQTLRGLMSERGVAAPIAVQPNQEAANESSTAHDEPSLPVSGREQRPAIVVDGIDTIALQHGWESEQIAKFFSTLSELQASDPDILVLLATGSSFLDDLLQRVPNASKAQNVYTLPRMKPEGMALYLEGVTRLLGMRLEAGLVERIVTDTDRSGVPSRSLRILIARLCERSRGEMLTHEEYAAVGGIEGVTRDEVGAALSSISGSQLAATKALVTNLIQVRTGTRRNLPRDTLLKIAGDIDGTREALVQLFDWNVLATDSDDAVTLASDGIVKLDIVQEWVREDYEKLKLQADLEDLAQKWDEVGRPENLLPHGGALARYRNARVLGPLPAALLDAAVRANKKAQHRSAILGFSILGGVVILFVVGVYGIYELVRSRSELKAKVEEVRKATATLENLGRDKDDLIRENAQLRAELENRRQRQAEQQQTASSAFLAPAQSSDIAPSAAPAVQSSPTVSNRQLPPRIYFETGSSAGSDYAKKLEATLKEAGFPVQNTQDVGGGSLGYSEVKYYSPEDLAEAQRLVHLLQSLGVKNLRPEPRQIRGPSNARPRHYDVWIEPPRAEKK